MACGTQHNISVKKKSFRDRKQANKNTYKIRYRGERFSRKTFSLLAQPSATLFLPVEQIYWLQTRSCFQQAGFWDKVTFRLVQMPQPCGAIIHTVDNWGGGHWSRKYEKNCIKICPLHEHRDFLDSKSPILYPWWFFIIYNILVIGRENQNSCNLHMARVQQTTWTTTFHICNFAAGKRVMLLNFIFDMYYFVVSGQSHL